MNEYLPQSIKAILYTRIRRIGIRFLLNCFPGFLGGHAVQCCLYEHGIKSVCIYGVDITKA